MKKKPLSIVLCKVQVVCSDVLNIGLPVFSVILIAFIQGMQLVWLMTYDSDRNWSLWWENRAGLLIQLICMLAIYCVLLQFICRNNRIKRIPFYIISIIDAMLCLPLFCVAFSSLDTVSAYKSIIYANSLIVLGSDMLLMLCHINLVVFYKKQRELETKA